jgi:hypothetical protein
MILPNRPVPCATSLNAKSTPAWSSCATCCRRFCPHAFQSAVSRLAGAAVGDRDRATRSFLRMKIETEAASASSNRPPRRHASGIGSHAPQSLPERAKGGRPYSTPPEPKAAPRAFPPSEYEQTKGPTSCSDSSRSKSYAALRRRLAAPRSGRADAKTLSETQMAVPAKGFLSPSKLARRRQAVAR